MISVVSLKRITSRIPPAIQSLLLWEKAPTSRPINKEAMTGACKAPGPAPALLNANKEGAATNAKSRISCTAGNATPSSLARSWLRPREKPRLRNNVPIQTPKTKPKSPIKALRSPAPSLSTMRRGQPRNTKAPIIMTNPNRNRNIGEEPPLVWNSPFMQEMMKAPSTKAGISGLTYWTAPA